MSADFGQHFNLRAAGRAQHADMAEHLQRHLPLALREAGVATLFLLVAATHLAHQPVKCLLGDGVDAPIFRTLW